MRYFLSLFVLLICFSGVAQKEIVFAKNCNANKKRKFQLPISINYKIYTSKHHKLGILIGCKDSVLMIRQYKKASEEYRDSVSAIINNNDSISKKQALPLFEMIDYPDTVTINFHDIKSLKFYVNTPKRCILSAIIGGAVIGGGFCATDYFYYSKRGWGALVFVGSFFLAAEIGHLLIFKHLNPKKWKVL